MSSTQTVSNSSQFEITFPSPRLRRARTLDVDISSGIVHNFLTITHSTFDELTLRILALTSTWTDPRDLFTEPMENSCQEDIARRVIELIDQACLVIEGTTV